MSKGRLRWKRHPPETGLRAVGAAPRGWDLHDGVEVYASVYPKGGGWQSKQNGWYWVAAANQVPWRNTSGTPVADPDKAKAEATAYVKAALAKATGGEP